MRDDIKKRIDAVRCGEVPEGYFRTRAGLMPVDWNTDCRAKSIFKNHSNKNHDGKYEVLSATQDRGIIPRSEVDIDIKFDEGSLATYKKVDVGDFVISLRSFQGGIEYSEYEGLVSPAYTVLKPCKPIDSGYYRAYFKTQDFINRLNGAVYGIRDGKQIGYEDFGDLMIHCPPIEEQQKIAEILSACDRVIELKKKLVEELQQLKKTCLVKMFPKKGCTIPEIRFPGFTDPWEQRKFGDDVLSIQAGTNRLGSENGKGTPLLKMGNIQRGYFSLDKLECLSEMDEVETENIACYGDFFINTRNTLELVGKGATWTGSSGEFAFNSNIARFELRELDAIFFNYLYNTRLMIEQVRARAVGTTSVAAIYPQSLKSIEYYTPPMVEQVAIGAFLLKIDNFIILHQRELEEAKQKKKALMQLLLTGLVRVNV